MNFEYRSYDQFVQIVSDQNLGDTVQRYIFDLFPYCFKDEPDVYWELRERICSQLSIHPMNFSIAGSGKLGFSIAPMKYGNVFNDESDIDIILVSEQFFDDIWDKIISFRDQPTYRLQPQEVRKAVHDINETLSFGHFGLNVVTHHFDFAKDWWKFFNELSVDKTFGPREINAAVFRKWAHVDRLYVRSLQSLKSYLNEVTL